VVYERILNHYPTTADGIAQAIADLNEAIGKLVLNTDKAGLLDALANTPIFADEPLYTPESWAPYALVRQNALNVAGDPNATQEEIDEATEALLDAAAKLVRIGGGDGEIVVATGGRRLLAAQTGDGSDWIEIARTADGIHSLILRVDKIGNSPYGPSGSYEGTLVQAAVNNWYESFATGNTASPLVTRAVTSDVMDKLGTTGIIDNPIGFSVPTGNRPANTLEGRRNTTFLLSWQEVVKFCSNTIGFTAVNFVHSSQAAKDNWNRLGNARNEHWWLRPATSYANASGRISGMIIREQNLAVRPAMWVESNIFNISGGDEIVVAEDGRRLTAAQAGDGSEWIEIARTADGRHSLILRVSSLGSMRFGNTNDYSAVSATSTTFARGFINNWFGNLPATALVRAMAVDNDVMSRLGTANNITDANGISAPKDTAEQASDIAFLLSFQEAARYVAMGWSDGSATSVASSAAARNNWQAGLGAPTPTWWLRSPGEFGAGSISYVTHLGTAAGNSGTTVSNAVRPAIWVNSNIFSAENLIKETPVGGTFFIDGLWWRVLSKTMGPQGHGSGMDVLVLSEHVLNAGAVRWNQANAHNGGYNASDVRNAALKNFYDNQAHWAHNYAVKPASSHPGSWGGTSNANAEFTVSTAELVKYSENTLDGAFLLSVEDVFHGGAQFGFINGAGASPTRVGRALTASGTVGNPADWWLRSPVVTATTDAYRVAEQGNMGSAGANTLRGLRPAMLLRFEGRNVEETPLGGIFTDSSGVVWRVLAMDSSGNKLITTEHVHGFGTIYHSTNIYIRLHNSNRLRPTLNTWFNNTLAPELKAIAMPAENLQNDVRPEPGGFWTNENEPAGWTSAGLGAATASNALFVLSVSEANRYATTLNRVSYDVNARTQPRQWWLRSPGGAAGGNITVAHIDVSGSMNASTATNAALGFRPALWVNASGGEVVAASGRRLTAAQTGDGSDWIEIARTIDNQHSLILRVDKIGNSQFGAANAYAGSTAQATVNNWYEGVASGSPLRTKAVTSDVMDKIHNDWSVSPAGISLPTGNPPADSVEGRRNTAFLLSVPEAALFSSTGWILRGGSGLQHSSQAARDNWNALSENNITWWLRSNSISDGHATEVNEIGMIRSSTTVIASRPLRPAIWVNSSIFN